MRSATREQLLAGALKVFAARGLGATRISDIAAEAGVAQGLLYHYFRTKEEMYVELVRSAFERMNEAARALEELPLSPREKIAKAIADLLRLLEEKENFSRYFMLTTQASMSAATPEEAKAIIRRQRAVPYDALARILRAGQQDGTIRQHDADELAVLFWVLIKGLAMQRAAFGRKFQAPDPRLLSSLFFSEPTR